MQVQTFLDPQWSWPPNYPTNETARREKFNADLIQHCVENEIAVVAITDHNSGGAIDNLLRKNESLNEPITILPGVEVISSEGIHILAIFNPSSSQRQNRWDTWDETIRHFLTAINMPQPAFLADGNNTPATANYTAEDIISKIHEHDGVTIFAHATSTNGGLFCKSDARTRKRLLKGCTILDAAATASDVTSRIESINQKLADHERSKEDFSIINTSDSRNISNIGAKFTWIKADPTFEGLKQIIFEPQLRTKIQEESPAENEIYARVSECVVDLPPNLEIETKETGKKIDFCLRGEYKLQFSNNLTCIIGGRGSGKSTLVHILYNKWNKREDGKLHEAGSPIEDLDLPPDPLSKIRILTTADIPEDTEFFLQNEIEKFARDIDEMSNLVRYRLERLSALEEDRQSLKELRSRWADAQTRYKELKIAYDFISETNKKVEELQKKIDTLRKQTEVMKSKEYKKHQEEVEKISEEIAVFKKYKAEHASLIEEVTGLIETVEGLGWKENQGKNILDNFKKELQSHKQKLAEKFSEMQSGYEKYKYPEKLTIKKQQLKKYLEKKGLAPENIEELADASEQIKELSNQLSILEKEKAPYEETYSKQDAVFSDYQKGYEDYRNRFFQVASRLEKTLAGLSLSDQKILFKQKVNFQPLKDAAVEFVKRNGPSRASLRTDEKNIQNVLFDVGEIAEYIADKNRIRKCINESKKTVMHKQVLQELINDDIFLNRLHLQIVESYFDISNIQVQTQLGDNPLQSTSFGERCGIVIAIVLVAGTNPIIVDQPEDNLDGKFISTVLVPLVRDKKQSRQIILITRDANIVVGGDAELIHILDNDHKKIKVIPSSIENVEHREKYIWILDGGKEAFQKREQKYSFSK